MRAILAQLEDGLALRSQPVIDPATLLKRLPVGTDLLVIEPAEGALPKLGVEDQWLNVRDITGSEGFVAAWFVLRSPSSAPSLNHP